MDATLESMVAVGRRIAEKGFVIGSGGNISVRTDGAVYIKASGVHLATADPSGYVALDPETGEPMADGPRPSVECPMHMACYRARDDIAAVVHCHPSMAIAWAATGEDLGALTPDSAVYLGERVPVLPYYPPSSDTLAKKIEDEFRGGANAVILSQHGICVTGRDIEEAFRRACLVEETARIAVFSRLLNPDAGFFTSEQIAQVQARAYGLLKGRG